MVLHVKRKSAVKMFMISVWAVPVLLSPSLSIRQYWLLSLDTVHDRTPDEGLPSFRAAIAKDLSERYGMDVSADSIYVITGTAGGLAICANTLLQPGEEAIVFAPFFTEYRVFLEGADGVVVKVPPAEDFQPDLEAFAAAITEKTKLVVVNTPNNPTGAILSEKSLERISIILHEAQDRFGHPIYLISDEPYRELVYDRDSIPCVMNAYENTIVCYSFSKSLSLPEERIGYTPTEKNRSCQSAATKRSPTFRFPEYVSPKMGYCFYTGAFPLYYYCRYLQFCFSRHSQRVRPWLVQRGYCVNVP